MNAVTRTTLRAAVLAALALLMLTAGPAMGQAPEPPLNTVPVPEPANLMDYVANKAAAIQLGKALFWDMQTGSDGVQACATCHFQAGADVRPKATMHPGFDGTFNPAGGVNRTMTAADYPFFKLSDPDNRNSTVLFDTNDVQGSQGVFLTDFLAIRLGYTIDAGVPLLDPVFNVGGINARQVTGRNTPPAVNAIFNYSNFWDGRANFYFNGVNPFGPLDQTSGIFVGTGNTLTNTIIRLPYCSVASQAVGPPLSSVEMSFTRRTWPDVGRRLLNLRPLAKQMVHPSDSRLGTLAMARRSGNNLIGLPGLRTTYTTMVQRAFKPEFWTSTKIVRFVGNTPLIIDRPARPLAANEYTQMEANFSFFWGLAIQLYEATLVADDTPYDRFAAGNSNALTDDQKAGMSIFFSGGSSCSVCHSGPEFTAGSVSGTEANGQVSIMNMAQGSDALYDEGYFYVPVRPVAEDVIRGGDSPFLNPLTGHNFPLSWTKLALLKAAGQLPPDVAAFTPDLPTNPPARITVDGNCKVPHLRNIELTGPYMRNGGFSTLRQVVQMYARGGNFTDANIQEVGSDIHEIGQLKGSATAQNQLVAFLTALTDNRVRTESAPFDHPQIFIPNGLQGDQNAITGASTLLNNGFKANEIVIELKAVGAGGRPDMGIPNVQTYLGLPPTQP